jgi:hypothetical protein
MKFDLNIACNYKLDSRVSYPSICDLHCELLSWNSCDLGLLVLLLYGLLVLVCGAILRIPAYTCLLRGETRQISLIIKC